MTRRFLAVAGVLVMLLIILLGTLPAGAPSPTTPIELLSAPMPTSTTGSQPPSLPQAALSPPQLTTVPALPLSLKSASSPSRVVEFQYLADRALFVVTGQLVGVFDLASKAFRWSHTVGDGCCGDMAISATSVAVIGGRGEAVYVWDSASGQPRFTLRDTDMHFSTLAFDPTGTILATGKFAQIRLWDARSGQQRSIWQTGDEGFSRFPWTKGITNLAFTPDGRSLFSANWWTGRVMQ